MGFEHFGWFMNMSLFMRKRYCLFVSRFEKNDSKSGWNDGVFDRDTNGIENKGSRFERKSRGFDKDDVNFVINVKEFAVWLTFSRVLIKI